MSDVDVRRRLHRGRAGKVTPGSSALFAMTANAVMDKVLGAFRGNHAELLHTNLSGDQEAQLREVFGDVDDSERAGVTM